MDGSTVSYGYDSVFELEPRCLILSSGTRGLWIAFSDHVERAITPNGDLEPVRGLANKLPEHAARLAAILALVDDLGAPEIGANHLRAGIALSEHYALKHCAFSARAASTSIFGSLNGFSTGFSVPGQSPLSHCPIFTSDR